MTTLHLPELITAGFLAVSDNPYVILFMINILLLILGGPMDMAPMIVILSPILLPVCMALGMDPIHFGIMMIFILGNGLVDAARRDCFVRRLRDRKDKRYRGNKGNDAFLPRDDSGSFPDHVHSGILDVASRNNEIA